MKRSTPESELATLVSAGPANRHTSASSAAHVSFAPGSEGIASGENTSSGIEN